MALTPTKVVSRKNAVALAFAGETVNLEYYPTAISNSQAGTLRDWVERAQAASEADQLAVMTEFGKWLCTILASWDYVESINEDGTLGPMVPITPDSLAVQLSTYSDFMWAAITAIFQDFQQKNVAGTTSPAPSDATS